MTTIILAGLAACGEPIAPSETATTDDSPGVTTSGASATDDLSASATSASNGGTTATTEATAADPTTTAADPTTSAADETTGADPYCGDGAVDPGEACDDGPGNAHDAACTPSCQHATCGDGLVQFGVEACDLGRNDGGYDGCLPGCSGLGPHCGDGIVQEAHEECEAPTHGSLCAAFCTVTMCAWLPHSPPSAETCPPDAQVNAQISGETPLGPFAGTFTAQTFGYGATPRELLVTPAYTDDSLCDQPHLIVGFDEPFGEPPGVYPVHILAVIDGASAITTGTIHLTSDDYDNLDADPDCSGTTAFELTAQGDGWSLSGAGEAGCCRSSPNEFVQ